MALANSSSAAESGVPYGDMSRIISKLRIVSIMCQLRRAAGKSRRRVARPRELPHHWHIATLAATTQPALARARMWRMSLV